MESVEVSSANIKEEFASRYNMPGPNTQRLKNGINIDELKKGVQFELQKRHQQAQGDVGPNSYNDEDILNYLNYECIETEEDKTPFEIMGQGMSSIIDDNSVLKKITRPGTGALVPEGATCRVHYNGYLEYSEEPFDSSRMRNEHQLIRLGQGDALEGWEMALLTMRKGEISRFLMHYKYCYGEMGCPPRIPAKSTMMFEIELINFIDHKVADDFQEATAEEKKTAPFEQILAVVNAEREAGNDFFKNKLIAKALNKYGKAINLLEGVNLGNEQEEFIWKQALLKLYLNTSLCCIKQQKSARAITYCRKILEFDDSNVKAVFRLGQAHYQLGEFEKCRSYLTRALKMAPNNADVQAELRKLDTQMREYKAVERETYRRMFGNQEPSISVNTNEKRLYTDEMQQDVQARLTTFADSAIGELPFPTQAMDDAERQCMEHVCTELKLAFKYDGEGDERVMKVSKSKA